MEIFTNWDFFKLCVVKNYYYFIKIFHFQKHFRFSIIKVWQKNTVLRMYLVSWYPKVIQRMYPANLLRISQTYLQWISRRDPKWSHCHILWSFIGYTRFSSRYFMDIHVIHHGYLSYIHRMYVSYLGTRFAQPQVPSIGPKMEAFKKISQL